MGAEFDAVVHHVLAFLMAPMKSLAADKARFLADEILQPSDAVIGGEFSSTILNALLSVS